MTSGKDDFDLDTLKSAMAAATPAPDAARRAENLARAQENFIAAQGLPVETRQTSIRPEKRGILHGVFEMIMTRTMAGLTATTAIVAVGLLYFTPLGQDLTRDRIPLPETGATLDPQVPVVVDAGPDAPDAEASEMAVQTPPVLVDALREEAREAFDGRVMTEAEAPPPLPSPAPTARSLFRAARGQ